MNENPKRAISPTEENETRPTHSKPSGLGDTLASAFWVGIASNAAFTIAVFLFGLIFQVFGLNVWTISLMALILALLFLSLLLFSRYFFQRYKPLWVSDKSIIAFSLVLLILASSGGLFYYWLDSIIPSSMKSSEKLCSKIYMSIDPNFNLNDKGVYKDSTNSEFPYYILTYTGNIEGRINGYYVYMFRLDPSNSDNKLYIVGRIVPATNSKWSIRVRVDGDDQKLIIGIVDARNDRLLTYMLNKFGSQGFHRLYYPFEDGAEMCIEYVLPSLNDLALI